MKKLQQELLEALVALDDAVKSLRTAGTKPDLAAHIARIEALSNRLPRETSPDLLHFLQRKSYEKARLFLEGRFADIQRGNCRR